MTNSDIVRRVTGIAAAASLVASTYAALALAPVDGMMGVVQRIMYIHVPTAWVGFLAFFVTFVTSILYLVRPDDRWDRIARSSAELGVVFIGVTIILGGIWGKPTWGVWWTWDPRLTTSALLLVIYLGYLAVRGLIDDRERRAKVAAAVGIIGFLDVPVVYLSVLWWRTLHQAPSSPETIATPMLATLWLSVFAYTLLFAFLIQQRVRLAEIRDSLELAEVVS